MNHSVKQNDGQTTKPEEELLAQGKHRFFTTVLKLIGVLIVGLAAGVIGGIVPFIGDIGPHEGPFGRPLFIWSVFLLGGLYIGVLLPKVWYLSIFIAFFPILGIITALFSLSDAGAHDYNKYYSWILISSTLISPIVALVSGYIGFRIHKSYIVQKLLKSKKISYAFMFLMAVPPLLISIAFVAVLMVDSKEGFVGIGDRPSVGVGEPLDIMASPSPMHSASEQGNLAEITRLIEQGEDVNIKDMAGRTPLHYAVGEQQLAAVELLLLNGANPDFKDDEYHVTPLHWAVGSGNIEMVELIAPKVNNIDATNKEGKTAADIAFMDHKGEILLILIKYGARLNIGEQ